MLNFGRRPGGVELAAEGDVVIWFFEKKGEHLRCEIDQQLQGDKFALIVTLPDGSEQVELFEDSTSLNKRAKELERTFHGDGWDGPFGRDY
jgi:hypothetical protein